jgi:ABC-type transporter MlaC component
MRIRSFLTTIALAASISLSLLGPSTAYAGEAEAQGMVESRHAKLAQLLKQPESAARNAQVDAELSAMVDYAELTRRIFGSPCPAAVPSCTNHWNELNPTQQARMQELFTRLVQKSYRKNLVKTLDYDVAYRSTKTTAAGEVKVRTEAKSKSRPRDPAYMVDYLVLGSQVVDIVTENSSMVKNYNDQVHRTLINPQQGFKHLETKLQEKVSQP